jgi:hypothetical protein
VYNRASTVEDSVSKKPSFHLFPSNFSFLQIVCDGLSDPQTIAKVIDNIKEECAFDVPKVVLPKSLSKHLNLEELHSLVIKDMLFTPDETSKLILDVISEQIKEEHEPKVPYLSELLDETTQ